MVASPLPPGGSDPREPPKVTEKQLTEMAAAYLPLLGAIAEASRKAGLGPPKQPPYDPNAPLKKFKAKRINEMVKLASSLANTLAGGVLLGAYVLPEIKHETVPQELDRPTWVGVSLALFAFGQFIVWFGYQKED